jgi:hypothetical protein
MLLLLLIMTTFAQAESFPENLSERASLLPSISQSPKTLWPIKKTVNLVTLGLGESFHAIWC